MHPNQRLLHGFDGHQVEEVREALAAGADAVSPIDGKTPLVWLLEQYLRSDRLKTCIQLLLDHGATPDDPYLLPVVMNDGNRVRELGRLHPEMVRRRYSMASTFVALRDVTLLHIAAEYGCEESAIALLDCGASVDAIAGFDANGMNGHTPLFHTVNSNANRSAGVMRVLLAAGANPKHRVRGLVWGEGFPWETLFVDVSPISFAQMGLLPQVHRDEVQIYDNLRVLSETAGEPLPEWRNVPNRYLVGSGHSG